MLADGRLVHLVQGEGGSTLQVLTSEGVVSNTVQLGLQASWLVFGFQPSPTTLVIATLVNEGQRTNSYSDWTSHLVDFATGGIRIIAPEHLPAKWWYSFGEITKPVPVGSPAARLLIGHGRTIRMWDPETDEITPLLPRG
jgi:hypothetical protein